MKHLSLRRLLPAIYFLLALIIAPGAWAQVQLATINTPYTQNFNSLAATGTSAAVPTGFAFVEAGSSANATYTAGTGSIATGDTYSFGASGDADRAFGGLLSGTLTPIIGASFVNNTSTTITSLSITYTGEEWRLGMASRADRLDFQYSTNATSLTTGTYTDFDGLDFSTPNQVTAGVKNGNDAANRASVAGLITGLSIAPGQTFWIRYTDFNATGSDDGLAVDDFSLTPIGTVANPTVSLAVSPASATEADATVVTVTATASSAVTGDQTVSLAVAGTGITTGDYMLSNTTITIPGGATSGSVTFTVVDDSVFEELETATLTISNPSAGIMLGTPVSRDVAITDNDPAPQPDLTVSVSGPSSATAGQPYTYSLVVANGGAAGATGIPLSFTLPAGVTFVSAPDAGGFTATQMNGVVLFTGGNITPGNSPTLTVTVSPNAAGTVNVPPGAAFVDPNNAITESSEINNTSVQTVTTSVVAACPAITATLTGTSTICAGSTANLAATITGGTGPYSLTYSDGTANTVVGGYISGTNIPVSPATTTTYTLIALTDANVCPGTVSGAGATVTVNSPPTPADAGPAQTITLGSTATLAANAPMTGTGMWSVASGPSTDPAQFSSVTNPTATFTPAGGAGSYVLTWTISNAPCPPSASNVTITVVKPTVNLSVSSNTGSEAAPVAIVVTATASAPVVGDQTVDLAITGTGVTAGDYTLGGTTITILNGQTAGSVTFTVVDDNAVEGPETATLAISNPSANIALGGTTAQDIAITDNDAVPGLSINNVSANEGNAGTTTFTFTVSLSAPAPAGGITFDITTQDGTATAGSDYTARSLTGQTIPAGSSTYDFAVLVTGDATFEPDEQFLVNVSNVTGALVTNGQGTGTISNDDAQPLPDLTIALAGPSSATVAQPFTYSLTVSNVGTADAAGITARFTLPAGVSFGSAAAASGFAASQSAGVVSFTGGSITAGGSATVTVTVNPATTGTVTSSPGSATVDPDNTIAESNETNNGSAQTVTTTVAAPPAVNLSVSAGSATENPAQTVTVTATASSPVIGDQTVVLGTTGSATPGADYFVGIGDTEIKILNGQTQGSTSFNVINDDVVEGTETATLSITSVTSGLTLGTVITQNIDIISDDVTPAVLTVSPTSLTFTTTQGTASAEQSYVVSATALTADVTLTASAGVEISLTSGSGFAASLTLPALTTSATIYARLSAGAAVANPFSGTITNVSGSLTATVAVSGTVTAANAAPTVANAIPPQSATVGQAFSYGIPANTFADANGDALTLSVSGLPDGLTFSGSTSAITGTPTTATTVSVTVTATDPGSLSASTTFTLTVNPTPVVSVTGVVISQVYGGGSNTGAPFRSDYIELFNRTNAPISINGWSVQYAAATGTTWQSTTLTGSIPAGGYYLVQQATNGTAAAALPTPDAIGTINLSGTAGKVALVSVTTALSGSCPSGASIVDFVGYGTTANCFEGAGPTPAPSNTTAALRKLNGCTETNNNSTDFATGTPTPRNSASPVNVCGAATPLALTFTASPDMLLTTGTTTLSATVSGGTTPYSYTFSGPGTIAPNGNTATVSNLPAGVQSFTVRVADNTVPTSQTISGTVSVTVSAPAPMNMAPTVANAIPPQSGTVGQAFSYVIPANTFADANGDALTLSVRGLPDGLTFSGSTSAITGTPSTTVGSPFTVTVVATDPGSLSVATTFAFTIRNADQAPVAPVIPNQTATVGVAFSFTVPAFSDPEGQPLTYTASGIPDPLAFDPATRVISGTPSQTSVSAITIMATDPASNTASATFSLSVNAAPIAPAGIIRITELMYDGSPSEFVELTNVGNAPIDLTGWSFDDNSRQPGSFIISAFGAVQPGESVIITERTEAEFRTAWYLPASVKVLAGNTNNLGRSDEVNIYDAANNLVDRLTYNDQANPPGVRTQNVSAWPNRSNLGTNMFSTWIASTVPDVQNSYSAVSGNVGNPGGYFVPLNRVLVRESAGNTRVTEGGVSDTYTIALNSQPTADVTVTVNAGTQLTVNQPTLTFTPANFSTVQTVTVTAVDDATVEGVHSATITQTAVSSDVAYNSIVINPVSVTITDNDVATTAPPTIQVASTTTRYLSLPANGPGFVSGVAGDPTDPVSTLGVSFTLTDADTDVNSLSVTATSSTGNATLNLTGSGSSRNLKIIPAGIGYSTVTVTVTDGPNATSYVINYAASAASNTPATTRFHTGTSDASTAIAVDGSNVLVADDENQTLRLYDRQNSGLPITSFDITSSLGLAGSAEVDLEASVRSGNRVFWFGSLSNSDDGASRPNRNRVFATDLSGSGAATTLSYVGRYDFLRNDIINWDVTNGHGKGANYYGLQASAAAGVGAKQASGFNVEGAEFAPDNSTVYVGFRAPQVLPASRTKALIVPITNLTNLVSGQPQGSATFGAPIELDLGGRGIREIRKNSSNQYVIIAGSAGDAGAAPNDFRLFTWTGNAGDAPVETNTNLASLNANGSFESIVEVPASLATGTQLQLLVDNGDAIYYNDGTTAKDLSQNNFKKFRSDLVALGAVLNTAPVATANANQTATVGVAFSYTVNAFTDSETPNGLTYTASISPANGLSFDPATRIISGTPSVSGVSSVTVTATDPGSLSASTDFTITVNPAPVVVTPLALTLTANPTMLLTTGTTTLSATVSGGTTPYSYTFSGPGTITPNGNTATVSNLPAGVQTFTVRVADATSPMSQTISATVSVTVSAANTAPTVANAIPPQSATVGQAFSYVIPANTFTDAETPNSLALSVSGLPAGLSFTAPATISGTPSMTGASTVTVTATDPGSLSASTTFTITVNPAGTTPTPTGPFAITSVTTVSCSVINAGTGERSVTFSPQYSGVTGQPITFRVVNELAATTSAGPYTLRLYTDNPVISLRAVQSGTAGEATFSYNWLAACNGTPPANTAPTVANAIPPQSATVGQAFSYVIPANTFTDAETPNSLVLSVSGLPAGLSFTAPATISGTPSMTGTSTVTVTATDPGSLSTSTTFTITVNPAGTTPTPTGPFAITGVTTIDCTPVADRINLTFNPRYAGLNGQPVSFQVVNELAATTNPGPYSLSLYADNPVITLRAVQSGVVTTFSYNWLAACNGPAPANTAPTVANAIPPQSATVGQAFSYVIPANTFTDAETPNSLVLSVSGLPAGLNFTAPATISGTPSMTGTSTVTVTATDPGSLSASTTFTITVNPAGTTPTPTGPFAITSVTTVSCSVINAGTGERSVTFSPQYSGVTGQPITFRVVNELAATTNPGPYTLRLYTDNPVISLRAIQSGTAGEATFSYNWLAACNSGARVSAERAVPLRIRVLGNPVRDGRLSVEISGVSGQPLTVDLTDASGRRIETRRIDKAAVLETQRFDISSRSAGVLLLRVSTPTQVQTVKVIKVE